MSRVPRSFRFSNPSALSHLITHNLGADDLIITVIDESTNATIIPKDILILNPNQFQIEFVDPRAIRGRVDE